MKFWSIDPTPTAAFREHEEVVSIYSAKRIGFLRLDFGLVTGELLSRKKEA
jgi:hypothetical protein